MEFFKLHQSSILLALSSICFIILLFLKMTTYLSKEKKRTLIFFTLSTFLMLISCRYSAYYQDLAGNAPYYLTRIWKYFLFFNVLNVSYFFNDFLLCLYKENNNVNNTPKIFNVIRVIILIGQILLIISQFTNLYYSYDSMNVYHREKFYFINYLIPLIATLIQYYILAKEFKNTSLRIKIPIILYFTLPVLGAVIQIFIQGFPISNVMIGGVTILLYLFVIYDANIQLKEKEKTEADLRLAKEIQQNEIPNAFPAFPGRDEFDLYAMMNPAKDVGGDFYDYYFIDDNHLALVIADVSGKSISGSLNMIKAKVLLKNISSNNYDPSEILCKLNNSFIDNNKMDMFVTMWFGIVEISTGKITFSNAGHPDAIIINDDATDLYITKHGIPIGVTKDYKYTNSVINLNKGDKLFIYTDGITDIVNLNNEEYGFNRLIRNIYSNKDNNVKEVIDSVNKELKEYSKGNIQFDDVTMLCFELNKNNKKEKSIMEVERKFRANLKELDSIYDYYSPLISKVVSPNQANKYNVVIDEVFSNIVKYAFKGKSNDNFINIKLIIDNKEKVIKMIFEDEGIMFNPLNNMDPKIDIKASDRKEGGLGIYIVKNMMDKVSYEYKDKKNILILEKKY